jgi:cytochrome c oxidase cbb3-type subunit 4
MLSGIVTLLLMLLFVAVWAWAWQPRLRKGFDDAARLALDDSADDPAERRP